MDEIRIAKIAQNPKQTTFLEKIAQNKILSKTKMGYFLKKSGIF